MPLQLKDSKCPKKGHRWTSGSHLLQISIAFLFLPKSTCFHEGDTFYFKNREKTRYNNFYALPFMALLGWLESWLVKALPCYLKKLLYLLNWTWIFVHNIFKIAVKSRCLCLFNLSFKIDYFFRFQFDFNPHMHEIFLQRCCMKWVPGDPQKEIVSFFPNEVDKMTFLRHKSN